MAELSDFPAFDPESVALMGGHRVGLLPPQAGSLIAGEVYIEVNIHGTARIWVGAPRPAGVGGHLILVASSEGVEQPPPPPTLPVPVDAPAVTVNGAVSATAVVGDTLSCTMGNWTGEPDNYLYSWRRDDVVPVGANDSVYLVDASDVDHSITCVVVANNAAGSVLSSPSNAVSVAAAARDAKAPEPEKPRRNHHR